MTVRISLIRVSLPTMNSAPVGDGFDNVWNGRTVSGCYAHAPYIYVISKLIAIVEATVAYIHCTYLIPYCLAVTPCSLLRPPPLFSGEITV